MNQLITISIHQPQSNHQLISSNPSFKLQLEKSTKSQWLLTTSNLCQSTENSEDSKFKIQTKQTRIKTLTSKDIFQCKACSSKYSPTQKQAHKNIQSTKCNLCNGKQEITGDNNYSKFFQYILQFKLGIKQSYQNRKSKPKSPKVNDFCHDAYHKFSQISRKSMNSFISGRSSINSQCKSISHSSIIDKCNEVKYVHEGYECDKCQMLPIQGSRFHCMTCDDFDLCQKCMARQGHQHRMKQYKTSSIHTQISGIINLIQKSSKMSSIRMTNSLTNSIPMKIYSSSIR